MASSNAVHGNDCQNLSKMISVMFCQFCILFTSCFNVLMKNVSVCYPFFIFFIWAKIGY